MFVKQDIQKRVEQLEQAVQAIQDELDSHLDESDRAAIQAFESEKKSGRLLSHEQVFDTND